MNCLKWVSFILITCVMINSCKTQAKLEDETSLEHLVGKLKTSKNPFLVVYGGVKVRNASYLWENGGFSHVMLGSTPSLITKTIPKENRAILWTGISKMVKTSPWATEKSPWSNDVDAFRRSWEGRLKKYSTNYGEVGLLNADLVVLDIEAELRGKKIHSLQGNLKSLPENLKSTNQNTFRKQYEKDMLSLSVEPVLLLKRRSNSIARVASYGDAPIVRTWYDIEKKDWRDWQLKSSVTNFLGDENRYNPFLDELNGITPSAYYFFPSGKNLAYLLFQIEANKAHSNKDLILFVTPRFVGKKAYGIPISENLAEATAIFPFFSGAQGLWLWEKSTDRLKTTDTEVLPAYKGFFRGLSRLSEYSDFFTGKYQMHIPISAHAAFSEKIPLWRGVVKGNKILIAAQNPYAKPGETTKITVEFGKWRKEIVLQGEDIFLEQFKLEYSP